MNRRLKPGGRMNRRLLAQILRDRAEKTLAREPRGEDDFHNAELFNVLARILEGKPIHKAFGAPGDWGYSNPIGKALATPPDADERECA
jgi:hypothetical protein